ncbi:toll-like receptor 6 [Amphibalanus amphitrite]|uniref:toll-like receptor 6 n=1 Tax=Amphibalanus amphitrite TaxID=1232801 RepID=UPI001C90C832|nr:toll-like receptor 6 [Amphibalanus amphitrite]
MRGVRTVICALLLAAATGAERCEPLPGPAARCHLTTLDAGPLNVTRPGSLRRLELVCSDTTHVSRDFSVALGSAFTELRELSVTQCALGLLRRGVFHRLRRLQTLRLRTFSRDWTAAEMRLERGCFDGLVHLETLDLSENNMWSLERGVFEDLTSLKVLNLSGNSFQDLTELRETGVNDGLQVLDVSYNSLMELSAAGLRSFPGLRELRAGHNQLAVIRDGALRDLRRLQKLDVSDNRLVALPAMMLNETRLLRELHVQNNSIRVLPPSLLSDLPQLQTVNMSANNLSSEWIRKDTFAGLLRLIVLDLSSNHLDALSVDVFQDLTSLQSLDLSENLLETLPDGVFGSLSNLHTLRLSDNLLRHLGRRTLVGLHVLSALRLDGNRLAQLDELTFANVTGVQSVRLDRNELLTVPAALSRLTFLARLDLGDNFISELPAGAFSTLRQLSALRLAGNQLVNVSARALSGPVALGVLDLSRNRLTLMESGALDELRELRVVRIDANRLTSINGLFAKLPQLLWLNASDNRVEFFDYALVPTGLRWLDLHRNQIREIGNFYRLESKMELRTIDLSHNQVSHLGRSAVPDAVEYFILAGNRLETVEPGTFEAKRRLVRVDLSANQLSQLDAQAVRLPDDHGDRPADLLLGGNPLLCDCSMDWVLTMATATSAGHQYRVLDADRIMCRLLHSPVGLVPLLETKPTDFLCTYERHCFALCHCCNYVACDCEMKCPDGCTCYHDHTWNTNMVECSGREQLAISREIPMDATAVFAAGNNIHSLESHTFIGRKRIRQLYVNNSNVEEIRNRSLNGLSALQVLRLEDNLLPELQGYEFDSLVALRELYLHNNRLRRIHPATFSRLRALEVLTLHGNLLVSFPAWRLSSPYLVELTLASNPWSCECEVAEPLAAYVRDHRAKIVDADDIQCEYVSSWPRCARGGLAAAPAGADSPVQRGGAERSVPLLAVLGGTALVVAAVVAALVFRFRGRLCGAGGGGAGTEPPAKASLAAATTTVTSDAEKEYDVFVTYSAQDSRFVNEVLAPELEHSTPSCRLCLLRRDAPSTGYLGDAVHHCVRSSRRTLLLVSRGFLDHEWCRFDFKTPHVEALRGSRAVVGVLVGVERHHMDADLRGLLRPSDCVRYGGPDFWRRLRALLPTGHGLKALYGLGPPPASPQPPPPPPPPAPGESPSPTCSTVISEDRSVGPLHGRSDSSHALVYSAQAPHNTSYSSLRPSEHTYMTIDHYHSLRRPSAPTESELYCTLEPELQPQMPSDPHHPANQGQLTSPGHLTHPGHPTDPRQTLYSARTGQLYHRGSQGHPSQQGYQAHPSQQGYQGLQAHPSQQGYPGHRGHVTLQADHTGHQSQLSSQQHRSTPTHSLWV